MGFAHLDRAVQKSVDNRKTLLFQVRHQFPRQSRLTVELVDDDAFDLEVGIVVLLQFLDVQHKFIQALAGEGIAVKGYQHPVSGYQRRLRVKIEIGRGVDINPIIFAVQFCQGIAQLVNLVARLQLLLNFSEVRAGRQQKQVFERGFPDKGIGVLAHFSRTHSLLEQPRHPLGLRRVLLGIHFTHQIVG